MKKKVSKFQGTAKQRIEEGIATFIKQDPFIGYCLARFLLREDSKMPTMGVQMYHGRVILHYNPEFTLKLKDEHLLGILEHELLHILHVHPARKGKRQHKAFNIAADLAINPFIRYKLPEWTLLPGRGGFSKDWTGKTAEWIYEQFPKISCSCGKGKSEKGEGEQQQGEGQVGQGEEKEDKKDGSGNGKDSQCPIHGNGGVIDDHSFWEETDSNEGEAVRNAMVQDALGKAQGKTPGNWSDMIQNILKSKTNWKQALRMAITSRVQLSRKRTWRVLNRRLSQATGFVFAGQSTNRGMDLVVAVDTSGSIVGEKALMDQFFTEVETIKKTCNAKICLIQCDADVQDVWKDYKKGDWRKIKKKGGGGTDFRPVFNYIKEKKLNPSAVVYLTDGYGTFPSQEKYRTIWCLSEPVEVPFGKKILLPKVIES